MQGQRDRRQELYCTYCKKSRHTIADCYTLKLDSKEKGYKIDRMNGGNPNFGKSMSNQQNQGCRWNNSGNNGGNGRNRGNGRQGFGNRDRFNMAMDDEDVDEGVEEGVDDEEDFFCHISDYMAATGYDVYDLNEESTNE